MDSLDLIMRENLDLTSLCFLVRGCFSVALKCDKSKKTFLNSGASRYPSNHISQHPSNERLVKLN